MDYQEIALLNMLNEARSDFNKMKNAKLSKENWVKLKESLTSFSKEINIMLENIEERHKYSSQIKSLEGMVATAEQLVKDLNSPEICQVIGVVPDNTSTTESSKPEEKPHQ